MARKKSGEIWTADGRVKAFPPGNGVKYELKELQEAVGGPIQIVRIWGGQLIVCNEEGVMRGLPFNAGATSLINSGVEVLGDVVVCADRFID